MVRNSQNKKPTNRSVFCYICGSLDNDIALRYINLFYTVISRKLVRKARTFIYFKRRDIVRLSLTVDVFYFKNILIDTLV